MKPHPILLSTPVYRTRQPAGVGTVYAPRPASRPRKRKKGAGGNGFLFPLCVLLGLGLFLGSAIVYAIL